MIRITHTDLNFEREPMVAPFGFKGGYSNENWQVVALMESAAGHRAVGLGVQGVLWSDANVFRRSVGVGGDAAMLMMTAHALRLAAEDGFEDPPQLLDRLLPAVHEYGKRVTGVADLRLTFALNALVPVDAAAWLLYCRQNGIENFDDMIPLEALAALAYRHDRIAAVPLMTYGLSMEQIAEAVDDGYFVLKVKIGADPAGDGDPEKMLEWDKGRLTAIHELARDREIPHTDEGWIPYYLDANGRYDSVERLERLLDHAESIGALERILILEEPFAEDYKADVSDLPVTVAADESAHSEADVLERIELGYRAIALKPIAKTMSMTFRMAAAAHAQGVPCFCADLTVNPVMVDWNKVVAARLAPLPGIRVGMVETNGHQNYANWERMLRYHPCFGAPWTQPTGGLFVLDDDFYARSGGIFLSGEHYESLVS